MLSERDKHLLVLAHILKQELTVEQQNEIVLAMDSALIENPRHLKALYTKGRVREVIQSMLLIEFYIMFTPSKYPEQTIEEPETSL